MPTINAYVNLTSPPHSPGLKTRSEKLQNRLCNAKGGGRYQNSIFRHANYQTVSFPKNIGEC